MSEILRIKASAGSNVKHCARFVESNTDYLVHADNAIFDVTLTDDFAFGGWVKAATLTNNAVMLMKGNASEYQVNMRNKGDGKCSFHAYIGNSGIIEINAGDRVTLGDWAWVAVRHTASTNLCELFVDGTTAKKSATASSFAPNAGNFEIGKYPGGAGYELDGFLDAWWYIKGSLLSGDDLGELYNGGAGAQWSDLSAALQAKFTANGAFWEFDEYSAGTGAVTRVNAANPGTYDLTDTGTTPSATGYIVDPSPDDGDPIWKLADQSGEGNDLTQDTAASQPEYASATPSLGFDGTDDHISITDAAFNFGGSDPFTVVFVGTAADGAAPIISRLDGTGSSGWRVNNNGLVLAADHAGGDEIDVGWTGSTDRQILVVVYDGSGVEGGVSVYRDGENISPLSLSGDTLSGSIDESQPMYVAREILDNNYGEIDLEELRIYNTAISPSYVLEISGSLGTSYSIDVTQSPCALSGLSGLSGLTQGP